jgi:Na+-transporting NADH:ubiquinone oxidoreductase subunit NqrF
LYEEFLELAKHHKNFQFSICLDAEHDEQHFNLECFFQGRVQERFMDHFKTIDGLRMDSDMLEYYICGSPTVVTILRGFLQDQKVPKEHIFFERF